MRDYVIARRVFFPTTLAPYASAVSNLIVRLEIASHNALAMTLLICPCQLTAAGGDVYAASHADRARDPSLLQRFFE